jgi:multiple sugar transport system substrate-binding protein
MTKRLVAVLGLVALAGVLVAASAQAGQKTHKVTNVTLAGWSSGNDEDALLQQVLNKFNQTHPSVHATLSIINTNYTEAMTARFAAHNPPDVFYVDSSVIGAWQHQGVIQSLNGFVKKSHFNTKKFFPKLLGAFKHGSKIYGFPKDWSPLATEINNSMFARAGVKVPKTWAQLKSVAKTMVQKGISQHPICLSADWARMGAFLYENGGSLTKNLTSKANASAVNFYVGLLKSGLAATPDKIGVGWCGDALGKGKSAIIFEGNWLLPAMSGGYPGVHYSIAPMVHAKKQGNLAFTVSYSMAKDSQNKQAAWTLLSWLVSKKGQKIWMSKGLALPSRTDVPAIGGRQPFLKAAQFSHGWGFGNQFFANAYTTMQNDLSAVISGSKSTSAMLSDAAKALKGQ